MAKKKEREFQYLMTAIPEDVKTYGTVKMDFSGMNLRHTVNSGVLSFEKNISTKEAPCLTPSPAPEEFLPPAMREFISEENAEVITAAAFGSFLAVVYKPGSPLKEVNELRVDYFEFDSDGDVCNQHTGVIVGGYDDSLEEQAPRTMFQFNTYSDVTDSVTGRFQNTLIVLPDRVSMPYRITTVREDPDTAYQAGDITDTDCMYCYKNGSKKAYYVFDKKENCFVQNGGDGYFVLSELNMPVETFYNDGYQKTKDSVYDPKQSKLYYKRTSTQRPYRYDEVLNLAKGDSVTGFYENTYDWRPDASADKTKYQRNLYNDYVYRYENGERYDADAGDTVEEVGWYLTMNPAMPDLKYAVVHQSRVFGVNDTHVFASCFNNYAAWQLDTATDINEANAWSSAAGSNTKSGGVFTGIALYENHVVCFKEDFMHEIYNNKNPFRIQDIYETGAIDHRSIAIAGGMLIFVSKDAVNVYTGGRPRDIGNPLGIDRFIDAVSGSDGRFYYLFCTDGQYKKRFFVYDTEVGQWSERETDCDILCFTKGKHGMYALFSDNSLRRIDTESYSDVAWAAETDLSTLFDGSATVSVKHLRKLQMTVYAQQNAYFKVWALYDNETFEEETSHLLYDSGGRYGLFPVRVKPRMTANYALKLRFEGRGYVKIYGLESFTTAGGELFHGATKYSH